MPMVEWSDRNDAIWYVFVACAFCHIHNNCELQIEAVTVKWCSMYCVVIQWKMIWANRTTNEGKRQSQDKSNVKKQMKRKKKNILYVSCSRVCSHTTSMKHSALTQFKRLYRTNYPIYKYMLNKALGVGRTANWKMFKEADKSFK